MAKQNFDSNLADSLIVSQSITPTTTKTFLLTQGQANQNLPLPYGTGISAPYAGQMFQIILGGLVTTAATGTLIIDPTHGPGTSTTAGGTSMGASPAQTVTASLSTKPWRIEGELIYRVPSGLATTTTAWFNGTFVSQGTLATAGSGWSIPMGGVSTSVDTSGLGTAGTFGAFNFYVTFSITGATITVEYSSIRSLN
jgi:hypothetical protein